ncbi:MAG: acyltransferase [Acidimicrobiales bacterium]|nr:acyltransferase [Acidimicrobiales bacterium]
MDGPDRPSLARLVEATPVSRDRLVDFLRAASIVVVVLGHWLIATVVRQGQDGDLVGENALVAMRWLQPATWGFQVMPVFFVVGGFSNARSLAGARTTVRSYLVRRIDRLLRPTLLFVAVWLGLAAILGATAIPDRTVAEAAKVAAQPLWFLAVYLVVVALAPGQLAVHRRHPWLALVALPAVVVGLDVCRFSDTAAWLALANYVAVFLFAQELGFHDADGMADRVSGRRAAAGAVASGGVLLVLTALGPYPVSMVGLPGDAVSNMSPPTVCVLVLTVLQCSVLLLVRPGLQRWLRRPMVWGATIAVNLVVLTLFLWHLTAFVAASAGLVGLGVPLEEAGTPGWWVTKALWIGCSALVLAALVAVASPVERRSGREPAAAPPPVWLLVVAVLLAVRGLAGLAWSGFDDVLTPAGRAVFTTRVSPLAAGVLVAVGWLVSRPLPVRRRGARSPRRGRRSPAPGAPSASA